MNDVVVVTTDQQIVVAEESGHVVALTPEHIAVVATAEQGIPGPQGDQGEQGEQGIPGLSGANFIYEQAVAAASWTIDHMLNRFPSITVVDSAGSVVYGDEVYLDPNRVRIEFGVPFSGKAYLN